MSKTNYGYDAQGKPSMDMLRLALGGKTANTGGVDSDLLNKYIQKQVDPGFWEKGGGFGNVMAGFNALTGGIGAYTGLKQLGLAEESFGFNKALSETNLANQAQTLNTQLEDRQRARMAANPGAYQSLGSYMDKHRVSGSVGG